mgnify:FL=1|tara:strand:- start:1997 stop:2425 length:429 start_codon:yes stop_codon:yes gene_type:complete
MKLRSGCPLNVALEIVGDKWSLLIIRDLLNSKLSFSDFLNSKEAIAKNILSDRLKKLSKFKIVDFKHPESNKKVKLYFLTKKGLDLYPTMIELMLWSKKHSKKLVTSVKGKNVLSEIIKNGKDKYIEKTISNYISIKEREII